PVPAGQASHYRRCSPAWAVSPCRQVYGRHREDPNREAAMRAMAFRRAARIAAGAAGTGAVGLGALAARAVVRGPGAAAPRPGQRPDRCNPGAPHSPQVLRQLAGGAASGGRAAGPIAGALQGVDVASFQPPGGAAITWAKVAA